MRGDTDIGTCDKHKISLPDGRVPYPDLEINCVCVEVGGGGHPDP